MFRRLLLLITVLSTAALAAGCETEVREANINQEQYINDYIEKNYADYEVVRNQGSNRIVLAVKARFSQALPFIKVTVTKCNPPVGGPCEGAKVTAYSQNPVYAYRYGRFPVL